MLLTPCTPIEISCWNLWMILCYTVSESSRRKLKTRYPFLLRLPGGSDLAEPRLREAPMWTSMERLKREREYIGFYLSGHPLDRFNDDTRLFCTHQLGDSLAAAPERANVTVAGIITVARHTRDKKGRPIAFVTIEDEAGTAELLMFSEAYDKFMNLIMVDNLVVVDGTADNASGQPKIIVRNMDRLENLREKNQGKIRFTPPYVYRQPADRSTARTG